MNAWRAAWDASDEGLVLFEDGRVRYLNPAAARLLDADPLQAEGRPAALVLRHHRLLELLESGGAARLTFRGRRLEVRAQPGRLYLRDVTGAERARAALEQERRMLAHEFRTPVAGLVGLIEVLEADPSPQERTQALALLREEAARLLRLVEGQGQARTSPWRLDELRPRLERLLPGAQALSWSTPHALTVDRDRVFQVLLNLVENALRYGKPPVEVRTRIQTPGVVAVEVVDAGGPLEDYERLFVPGGRGVHAAGVRGSGLGLALVRRIARGWGGEAYGRRLEEGNAFGVTVPAEEEEDA